MLQSLKEEKVILMFAIPILCCALKSYNPRQRLTHNWNNIFFSTLEPLCMKLKISTTTEPIDFPFLGKLHIAPVIVLFHSFF